MQYKSFTAVGNVLGSVTAIHNALLKNL